MRIQFLIPIVFTISFLTPRSVVAADPATFDNRMRDALRNTMLELRNCETEKALLQTTKAEADGVSKGLTAQVEALTAKGSRTEKALGEQTVELEKFKVAIDKWQAAYRLATEVSERTESERAKLAGKNILLQRRVEDQQRRNAALFEVGNEILTRFEHFGLGDALRAKEPFVGLTRVKMENLVQDYKDKLTDGRIKP